MLLTLLTVVVAGALGGAIAPYLLGLKVWRGKPESGRVPLLAIPKALSNSILGTDLLQPLPPDLRYDQREARPLARHMNARPQHPHGIGIGSRESAAS